MKIMYEDKNNVIKGLQAVQNIIGDSTILPIISNILIETKEDNIILTATDLTISIKTSIPIKIVEKGSITIPARKFSEIVKELPDDKTEIEVKENKVKITCGDCLYNIMGISKQEFPKFPEVKKGGTSFIINSDVLKELIRMVIFAVAQEPTRKTLNGICLTYIKDIIKLTATDGKRLAFIESKVKGESSTETEINIIIPSKCMTELQRILPDDKNVEVLIFENKVAFETENITLVSSLIEGQYPEFDEIINREGGKKIVLNSEKLFGAVKRVAIVVIEKGGGVKLNISKNKLVLNASTSELGEAEEKIEIKYDGENELIVLNSKYLIELLRNVCPSELEVNFVDASNAIIFKPSNYKDYKCVLMPIRSA